MTGITPAPGFVLILPEAAKTVSEGGLVIPDAAQDIETYGKIEGLGEGVTHIPLGSRVLFLPIEGTYTSYGGVQYLILSADNVLAIAEE